MRELALNILDIITNSVEAESTRVILAIDELQSENNLRIRIKDNGRGMSSELVSRVLDPFVTTRTTRSVGMGLSMLRQIAKQCGGDLNIQSELGKGTLVTVTMKLNNINRPPLGDIADSIVNLIIGALDVHFFYAHRTNGGIFKFDSYWMLAQMAERECGLYAMVGPTKEYIKENLKAIQSRMY